MSTKEYNPLEHSVVQALLKADATHRYEVPDYVEALLAGLIRELERCYWNWNQAPLEERKDWQLIACGFEYRRYCWEECDCGGAERDDGDHSATCSPMLPNFKFGDVAVNWYKHMGRGMSTNVDWNEAQWRRWFDECMAAIRLYDSCMQFGHHEFRDLDAGRKPFSTDERVQCKDCKYCVAFGANALIWNREGSRDVKGCREMTQPTPPPRCRVCQQTEHAERTIGSSDVAQHEFQPDLERRVSGERRKLDTRCGATHNDGESYYFTADKFTHHRRERRTSDRRKAGKL